MRFIYQNIILIFYALLLVSPNQIIINNPIKSNKKFNQINYVLFIKSYTEIKISRALTLYIKSDYITLFYDSYIFAQPLFIYFDKSNNYFIFIQDKYYIVELSQENEMKKENVLLEKHLKDDIRYLGYITELQIIKDQSRFSEESKSTYVNEIIIYGKSGNELVFYSLSKEEYYYITIENIVEQISCKITNNIIYICAFSIINNIEIFILTLSSSSKLEKLFSTRINRFEGYKNAILYDVFAQNYKILCAQTIDSNNIDCLAICFQSKSLELNKINDFPIEFIELENDYQIIFSYQEDNCNLTIFNSEYLLCCGKNNSIFCDRRDINLNFINSFEINLPGKILNLTFETHTEFIKLIYSNKTDNENYIYEYSIYPPKCQNIQIVVTSNKASNINLSDLFERKTNINYYIIFDFLPINFAILQINDEIINNNYKILTKDIENNNLDIIFKNDEDINNFIINYTISIEETYSKMCQIYLTKEPCYHSCKNCSKSIYNSDKNEHNCIKCKENYYPLENKVSNCFTMEEIERNWYFDENKKSFNLCHLNCIQCYGPYDNNCLSCLSNNINNTYLYKGKCLSNCPKGTFQFKNTEGNLIYENCYKNCETCSKIGNSSQMNCNSCQSDKITYNNGCYIIHDEIEKSFYNPENESEIASCYELFGNYIKENTNSCIDEIEDGYFISNPKTGLLAKSNYNCISYSLNKTYCKECKNNLYLQDGICVEECSSHYYLYNNTCYQCHENCLNCINGEIYNEGKLISMECIQCKNETMIQKGNNCFPINIYVDNIAFNISESEEERNDNKTYFYFNKSILYNSYELISNLINSYYVVTTEESKDMNKFCNEACDSCFGWGNSQDTNCIKCSPGYYKTVDSDTNCILENLIPSNYYKNETDNIFYKNKNIPSKNNIELIFDFISSNESSSIISNSEIIQIISTSDKMSIEEQIKSGISPVDLGDCSKSIKDYYNISKEENFIILNQEKKYNNIKNKSLENNKDNSISLGKYSQIEIYDFSGRKLDLSVCKEEIKLLKYIGDVEEININSAKNFDENGIDIFNASSDFFNNLCFQYKTDDKKDIIVKDRRSDIYQNI